MSNHTFTLKEALILVAILAIMGVILLPAIGAARRKARNNCYPITLMRGACDYAQHNKEYFPGLTAQGTFETAPILKSPGCWGAAPCAATPSGQGATASSLNDFGYARLLNMGMIAPKMLINCSESDAHITETSAKGNVDILTVPYPQPQCCYSYAVLNFSDPTLRPEWRDNSRSNAVLLGDRVNGTPGQRASYSSVTTPAKSGTWKGALVYGDAHCETQATVDVDGLKYGLNAGNCPDLFDSTYGWDPAANQFRGLLWHGCPTPP